MPKKSANTASVSFQTSCSRCPLRRQPAFRKFTAEELAFVQDFKVGELTVQAGSSILLDSNNSPHVFTILEGWAFRYKLFPDGARQVLNFALPGDLIGLQSALFDKMDHTVEALSEMRLCVFSRERIWEIYRTYPDLAFDLTWLAAREESILAGHLANVGQRSALQRLAYIILYIFNRARRTGLIGDNHRLVFPITQEHLADAMGLSVVHTNKTLQRMRRARLIEWKRQELALLDEKQLAVLAEFDRQPQTTRPFL